MKWENVCVDSGIMTCKDSGHPEPCREKWGRGSSEGARGEWLQNYYLGSNWLWSANQRQAAPHRYQHMISGLVQPFNHTRHQNPLVSVTFSQSQETRSQSAIWMLCPLLFRFLCSFFPSVRSFHQTSPSTTLLMPSVCSCPPSPVPPLLDLETCCCHHSPVRSTLGFQTAFIHYKFIQVLERQWYNLCWCCDVKLPQKWLCPSWILIF